MYQARVTREITRVFVADTFSIRVGIGLWLVSPTWFVGSFLRHCLPSSSFPLPSGLYLLLPVPPAFNVTAGCIGFPSARRFVFGILCFLKHKLLLPSLPFLPFFLFVLLAQSKVLREVENLKTPSFVPPRRCCFAWHVSSVSISKMREHFAKETPVAPIRATSRFRFTRIINRRLENNPFELMVSIAW